MLALLNLVQDKAPRQLIMELGQQVEGAILVLQTLGAISDQLSAELNKQLQRLLETV